MLTWTADELRRIADADELRVAAVRGDGSLRRATTIWVVPVGDDLYVRAAHGPTSVWYRGTRARREGHIQAGGVDRDVTFTDVPDDDPVNERIDDVYRSKYRRYDASYVDMMLAPDARAATLRLTPR
ncbi:DUF2255 family protein [Rugosimonospora africana]|uniref:DUF2255 family protein n=1 Tax=Rugosimonospora africana TaxID=556532 RepID=A0A8J3QQG7_9ACTN|nr:DUF2255 family protein [Rugosimonospora africana]GIH15044.1 hypothetical protein Raf01_32160 [Rugosimonospora africana]